MSEPLISLEAVTKSYDRTPILCDVDLSLAPAQTIGLLGANGAGKSTLIKSLLDLCAIDAGVIQIFGCDHRSPQARAQLAYLPENFQPPHYVRGEEFLRLMAGLHGMVATLESMVSHCRDLDLDPAALKFPAHEYSKGMLQKLGLIACLISERPLLVLDEPMSGLDPSARALFKKRLQSLKTTGSSVFFSTHLLDDVASLCDTVVVLDSGRVRFCGGVSALLAQHDSEDLEAAFLRCIEAETSA